MNLTHQEIIEIAEKTRSAESRDGDYILPISFAEAIIKANDEAAERATTASAAPTIGTATQFNVLLNEVISTYESGAESEHAVAWDALVKYVDDGVSALAEEAQREAAEAKALLYVRTNSLELAKVEIAALREQLAQRTEGGDAVIGAPDFLHVFAEHCEREGYPSDDADTQAMLWKFFTYGMACASGQPVAEAAAQADDWPMLDELHLRALTCAYEQGFGYGVEQRTSYNPYAKTGSQAAAWMIGYTEGIRKAQSKDAAPTAQPTPCPFLGSSSMTRGVGTARELRAAMEAAQTTPNENAPCLGRGVLGTEGASTLEGHGAERDLQHVPTSAEDASLAQPTPPGDEREPDLYDEIECDLPYLFGRASKEGYEAGQALAAEVREKMRRARAALRQPGALPDEAEDAAYYPPPGHVLVGPDLVRCAKGEGDKIFTHRKLMDWLQSAGILMGRDARALAAKQAGK